MNLLSRIVSSNKRKLVKTTADRPFQIVGPSIGFLNLQGDAASSLVESDKAVLAPLFSSVEVSIDVAPKCEVLFLYCSLDEHGKISGCQSSIRQLIESAGAYVAVVASENPGEAYVKALGRRGQWHANIALVLERKGEKFAGFFHRLFKSMYSGESMLIAWLELAPQIPGREHPEAPVTVMAAEAGHLIFAKG